MISSFMLCVRMCKKCHQVLNLLLILPLCLGKQSGPRVSGSEAVQELLSSPEPITVLSYSESEHALKSRIVKLLSSPEPNVVLSLCSGKRAGPKFRIVKLSM